MRAVPVAVHPSEAPLTVPEAPELATIGRSQARQVFEEQLAIKEEKLQARDQNGACSCGHLYMHWAAVREHLADYQKKLQANGSCVESVLLDWLQTLAGCFSH